MVRSVACAESGSVIFLEPKNSNLVVPIIVRKAEEESILIGMSRTPTSLPLSHDLFISLLKQRSLKLKKIEIYDHKDDLFCARIVLKARRLRVYNLDARPSDAIAIAVRINAPIYISNKVIQDTAISTSVMQHEEQNAKADVDIYTNEVNIGRLEHDLRQAVEKENYEEAARIRDKIQKLR